jgi:rubrerythrin
MNTCENSTQITHNQPGGRDSVTWWNHTKASPDRLARWLQAQLRGERTAHERIERFCALHCTPGSREALLIGAIAAQERQHALWIEELLLARGLSVAPISQPTRYWTRTLGAQERALDAMDFATGCAVGAHAEKMRLERIEAIASDADAPADIRAVFAKILPQERFHERAFRSLSTPQALERTRHAHTLGRQALGLRA